MDAILLPTFLVSKTLKFSVIDSVSEVKLNRFIQHQILIDINCPYSDHIATNALKRRPWCCIVDKLSTNVDQTLTKVQIGDFENIEWDSVLNGTQGASSYLVRKGLSRKAQLSLQIRKYLSKHPTSVLKTAAPYTIVLETWNAFEEMKLDFGRGTFASFDDPAILQAPLRQKLDWCLVDARSVVEEPEKKDWHWILKPSVTNKGADISIIKEWDDVLDAVEDTPDIREWVLQRYIADPLLVVDNYKFHLRVYVLCVGALRVFVFDNILMLLAAHKYELSDLTDIHKHLTNTARSAEDINFDEKTFVKLLDDLPSYLVQNRSQQFPSIESAKLAVKDIRSKIHAITADLFSAFENEYSIFCPMSNCYELYGLDFMVDNNLDVSLLEVNPGPDFKQTGDRLRAVIVQLYEQMAAVVIDTNLLGASSTDKSHAEVDAENKQQWDENAKDFTLVYSKEWSVSSLKGGMSLK